MIKTVRKSLLIDFVKKKYKYQIINNLNIKKRDNWMKSNIKIPDNLILDFGGVIYQIDHLRQIEAFVNLGIKDFGALFSKAHQSDIFEDFECGKLTAGEFIKAIKELLGNVEVSKERIIKAWNSILIGFMDDAVSLLKKLKDRTNLYLLSNTNEIHYEAFMAEFNRKYNFDFNSLFIRTFWSYQVGMRKPDNAIYNHLVQQCNLNPEKTLFIDDSLQNVEGAINAGLPAYYLKPPERLSDIAINN